MKLLCPVFPDPAVTDLVLSNDRLAAPVVEAVRSAVAWDEGTVFVGAASDGLCRVLAACGVDAEAVGREEEAGCCALPAGSLPLLRRLVESRRLGPEEECVLVNPFAPLVGRGRWSEVAALRRRTQSPAVSVAVQRDHPVQLDAHYTDGGGDLAAYHDREHPAPDRARLESALEVLGFPVADVFLSRPLPMEWSPYAAHLGQAEGGYVCRVTPRTEPHYGHMLPLEYAVSLDLAQVAVGPVYYRESPALTRRVFLGRPGDARVTGSSMHLGVSPPDTVLVEQEKGRTGVFTRLDLGGHGCVVGGGVIADGACTDLLDRSMYMSGPTAAALHTVSYDGEEYRGPVFSVDHSRHGGRPDGVYMTLARRSVGGEVSFKKGLALDRSLWEVRDGVRRFLPSGREVMGRQDFPPVYTPFGGAAAASWKEAQGFDALLEQGGVAGCVCSQEESLTVVDMVSALHVQAILKARKHKGMRRGDSP